MLTLITLAIAALPLALLAALAARMREIDPALDDLPRIEIGAFRPLGI